MDKRVIVVAASALVAGFSASASDPTKSVLIETLSLAQSGDVASVVEQKAREAAASYAQSETESLLAPYFDSLEVSVDAGDALLGPTYEVIGLKAYDDDGQRDGFLFNQVGLNRYDKRTTLNLGVGYRYLTSDHNWLFGVNAFYDHEFPNDHERLGYGAEVKSSVFKLGYNLYDGISGFKNDRSGTDSKALDGSDLRAELALPYMPGANLSYKKFEWEGEDGANDLEGEELSLKGKLSSSLYIDAGRTFYDNNARADDNWLRLTYRLDFGAPSSEPLLFDFADQAYSLKPIDYERYKPVQRENKIVKQKKFATTVTGN